jgi:hypothetical protein
MRVCLFKLHGFRKILGLLIPPSVLLRTEGML